MTCDGHDMNYMIVYIVIIIVSHSALILMSCRVYICSGIVGPEQL